jgi:hypothetical protein
VIGMCRFGGHAECPCVTRPRATTSLVVPDRLTSNSGNLFHGRPASLWYSPTVTIWHIDAGRRPSGHLTGPCLLSIARSASRSELVTDLFARQRADPKLTDVEALRQMALLDGLGFRDAQGQTRSAKAIRGSGTSPSH